jgi:hypothetical protein
MARRTEYQEEVGTVRPELLVGTFDEVIDNLKHLRDSLHEKVGLGDEQEDFFIDYSPFVDEKMIAELVVYRRGWVEER